MTKIIILLIVFYFGNHIFSESIRFSAASMVIETFEGNKNTILTGDAFVKVGSKEIYAEEIRLFGDDYQIMIANGTVEVTDLDENFKLISESLYYDRKSKISRINGRSVMEDYKNELIIKSGFLEYKENEQLLSLQIGVRILKDNLVCRAEFITYDKSENSLYMTGLPVVYKIDDNFKASKIKVLLDTDEIQMIGRVGGVMIIGD